MSLATTQSLSPDSPTDVDTNVIAFALNASDIDKSRFSVSGLTLPQAKIMTVSHETTKDGTQRHLVRLDITEVDALLVPATLSVYLVIARPPSTAISATLCKQAVYMLTDFLIEGGAGANITALLNNET